MDGHDSSCIRSCKNKNKYEEIPVTESFDFGASLESFYPLLEIVLSYLDYIDLKTASLVNKTWHEISEKELQKRQGGAVTWVSLDKPNRIRTSNNFNYVEPTLTILLCSCKKIKLDKFICLHSFIPETSCSRMTFAEYITTEIVPPSSEYCVLSCPSVNEIFVGGCRLLNLLKNQQALFSAVSFPVIPNIRIATFYCSPKKSTAVVETLRENIKPTECIKCLLLFCVHHPHRYIEPFMDILLNGQNPCSVAFGGGLVRGTKPFLNTNSRRLYRVEDFLCITFLQNQDVEADFNASSTVIYGFEEQFENKIIELKQNSILRTHGVAFRICCAAKREKNTESILFNKHFPNIPLLGLEADGELGWQSDESMLREAEDAEGGDSKKFKAWPEMEHQWSTIIVLLTWGKKIA